MRAVFPPALDPPSGNGWSSGTPELHPLEHPTVDLDADLIDLVLKDERRAEAAVLGLLDLELVRASTRRLS
jgi:hypothetical protein